MLCRNEVEKVQLGSTLASVLHISFYVLHLEYLLNVPLYFLQHGCCKKYRGSAETIA